MTFRESRDGGDRLLSLSDARVEGKVDGPRIVDDNGEGHTPFGIGERGDARAQKGCTHRKGRERSGGKQARALRVTMDLEGERHDAATERDGRDHEGPGAQVR